MNQLHTCALALFEKFEYWSNQLDSVLKTCIYNVTSSKNLWAQLEDPLTSSCK